MAAKETLSEALNLRLTKTNRAKAEYIAAQERRKVTEWGRLAVEDAIAAYEAQHGRIPLPDSPAPAK
ncbi:hypothetical protein GCM10027048_28010 [Hymenobacter coalescens]